MQINQRTSITVKLPNNTNAAAIMTMTLIAIQLIPELARITPINTIVDTIATMIR